MSAGSRVLFAACKTSFDHWWMSVTWLYLIQAWIKPVLVSCPGESALADSKVNRKFSLFTKWPPAQVHTFWMVSCVWNTKSVEEMKNLRSWKKKLTSRYPFCASHSSSISFVHPVIACKKEHTFHTNHDPGILRVFCISIIPIIEEVDQWLVDFRSGAIFHADGDPFLRADGGGCGVVPLRLFH